MLENAFPILKFWKLPYAKILKLREAKNFFFCIVYCFYELGGFRFYTQLWTHVVHSLAKTGVEDGATNHPTGMPITGRNRGSCGWTLCLSKKHLAQLIYFPPFIYVQSSWHNIQPVVNVGMTTITGQNSVPYGRTFWLGNNILHSSLVSFYFHPCAVVMAQHPPSIVHIPMTIIRQKKNVPYGWTFCLSKNILHSSLMLSTFIHVQSSWRNIQR